MGRPRLNTVEQTGDFSKKQQGAITPEDPQISAKQIKLKLKDNYYYKSVISGDTEKIKVYCKTEYAHVNKPNKVYKVDNRLVGVYKKYEGRWIGIGGKAKNLELSQMEKLTGLKFL